MNDKLIEISKGQLRVIFHPLGASIYAIYFNNEIMTATPECIKDFLKENIYHGKTIGPVCGRIKNGQLEVDGKTYSYSKNEGNNTLHGGRDGLSTKMFEYSLKTDGVDFTFEDEKCSYLISYTLTKDNSILLEFNVTSKEDIPIALTNHSYFCLGDSDLANLKLMIPADKFIEVDKIDMVPLRERDIIPCLDFNKEKLIARDLNDEYLQNSKTKGYDHPFILKNEQLVKLSNDKYELDITTSFESILIYSDNYKDGVKMFNSTNQTHRGIAIEPQDNQLERKTYRKYHRFIKYNFKKKN